jgi:hypothetical protein
MSTGNVEVACFSLTDARAIVLSHGETTANRPLMNRRLGRPNAGRGDLAPFRGAVDSAECNPGVSLRSTPYASS